MVGEIQKFIDVKYRMKKKHWPHFYGVTTKLYHCLTIINAMQKTPKQVKLN